MEMVSIIVNDVRSHQSMVLVVDTGRAVARIAGAAAALFGYDNVHAIDLQDEEDVVLNKAMTLEQANLEEGDVLEVTFAPQAGGV